MRVLGATLTAAQKAMGDAICKIVLTQQGDSTTATYGVDTTNRILNLQHPEQEWSQTAQVTVDNREGNLTTLALEGYSGVISYGYGSTYSPCAPLEVIAQKTDSMQGELVTTLTLAGIFNMMGEDHASVAYSPGSDNTDTVKTILTAIANKTLACFSHCKSYTIVFDDEAEDFFAASLINTFIPADYFGVGFKESRRSAFKKALSYSGDKARIEHDGYIHVFRPTTTGTTYDYEYNDAVTYHNFFNKSVRKRLVIPTKIVVSSHPDHDASYTGSATDTSSETALNRSLPDYKYVRTTGNAQCVLIATAILLHRQMGAEQGHGFAPMNCGQEVFDYVNITDSRANDTRAGNIGYLNRHYTPGKFEFEFRFGSLDVMGLAGTMPPQAITITDPSASLAENMNLMANYILYLDDRVSSLQALLSSVIGYLEAREEVIPKLHVTQRLRIPVGTDMYD